MNRPEPLPAIDAAARRDAAIALLLLVPAPTIGVLAAMVWDSTEGTTVGQAVYGVSKIWLLLFPVLWLRLRQRRPISLSPLPASERARGLTLGVLTGAIIAAAIIAGHWLVGRHVIDEQVMRIAAAENSLDQPGGYLAVAAYLTLINALVEEYVWRWFVYRQCETLIGGTPAVAASSLLFTAHHVIALKAQMDWTPTLIASAGIFIGGCVWSALYRRFRSIWPGYVSHVLADAAVFIVGWWILF